MSSIPKITILAISGSLKSTSSNTSILNTLSGFKKENLEFIIYAGLEDIPPFHPEKDNGNKAVSDFRTLLKKADAVIFSTPEYAFGVPGVLKNSLDWLVASGELNEKPVIAISASPLYSGGDKALASLLLTLSALGTQMNKESSLSISDVSNKIKDFVINDATTLKQLEQLYDHLLERVTY